VVVVVVVAMAVKRGKKVVSFNHTFSRRSAEKPSGKVQFPPQSDIENETEYVIELKNVTGQGFDASGIDPMIVKTHTEGNNSFSVPKSVVDEHGILPGHTVRIAVHEYVQPDMDIRHFDESQILGRANVVSDNTKADGCYPGLHSAKLYEALPEDEALVRFRNVSKKEEAVGETARLSSQDRIRFPKRIRHALDAEPGDLIEVIKSNHHEEHDLDLNDTEKIDEMYAMVSELYNAHLKFRND
jgi:hypothetical protein